MKKKNYTGRIHVLQQRLRDSNQDAVLVTNHENIFYLTGFRGLSPQDREAYFLVTKRNAFFFSGAMYSHETSRLIPVREGTVSACHYKSASELVALLVKQSRKDGTVGIEDADLSMREWIWLKKLVPARWVRNRVPVEYQRRNKDLYEINTLRKAVRITGAIYDHTLDFLRRKYFGVSEDEVTRYMRDQMESFIGCRWGFDPIVAAGKNSASPHHRTGQTKLRSGIPLLIDFGVNYRGYTSDVTRTLYLGRAPKKFQMAYQTVLDCNRQCMALCRPGVKAESIHIRAQKLLDASPVGGEFLHSLGHGLGIEVHESPRIAQYSKDRLEKGNVVTIEPGLYFDKEFGIRIEDDVLITDFGRNNLTKDIPVDLIEIV